MAKKYKRPFRKQNNKQTEDEGTTAEASIKAEAEVKNEANEQKQNLTSDKPGKCKRGAGKKKTMETKANSHKPTTFLTLPHELRQKILYETYSEHTKGLMDDTEQYPPCYTFIDLHANHYEILHAKVKNRSIVRGNKKYPKLKKVCWGCVNVWLGLLDEAEGKLKGWVRMLKLVHPDMVGDVEYVEGKWMKEYWHCVKTEVCKEEPE